MWDSLKGDIEADLRALRKELREAEAERSRLLSLGEKSEPSTWDLRAAGALLQNCYTGAERILEHIAKTVDGEKPEGRSWHSELIEQMSRPGGKRRAVISSARLHELMLEYLGFRHVARSHYGNDLDWDRVRPLLERLPEFIDLFESDLKAFVKRLTGPR